MYNSRCHKCLYYHYIFYMFDCGNEIYCDKIWRIINPNWYDRNHKCKYFNKNDNKIRQIKEYTEEKKQEDLKKLLSIKGDFDARYTNNKT